MKEEKRYEMMRGKRKDMSMTLLIHRFCARSKQESCCCCCCCCCCCYHISYCILRIRTSPFLFPAFSIHNMFIKFEILLMLFIASSFGSVSSFSSPLSSSSSSSSSSSTTTTTATATARIITTTATRNIYSLVPGAGFGSGTRSASFDKNRIQNDKSCTQSLLLNMRNGNNYNESQEDDEKDSIIMTRDHHHQSDVHYFPIQTLCMALAISFTTTIMPVFAMDNEIASNSGTTLPASVAATAQEGGKWFFIIYVVFSFLAGGVEMTKRFSKWLENRN